MGFRDMFSLSSVNLWVKMDLHLPKVTNALNWQNNIFWKNYPVPRYYLFWIIIEKSFRIFSFTTTKCFFIFEKFVLSPTLFSMESKSIFSLRKKVIEFLTIKFVQPAEILNWTNVVSTNSLKPLENCSASQMIK